MGDASLSPPLDPPLPVYMASSPVLLSLLLKGCPYLKLTKFAGLDRCSSQYIVCLFTKLQFIKFDSLYAILNDDELSFMLDFLCTS